MAATATSPVAPTAHMNSSGHTVAPSNPLPSPSPRPEASDVVDLTGLSNVWEPPADAQDARSEAVVEREPRESVDICEGGISTAERRWTDEALVCMLESMQRRRDRYDNGTGGFKQAFYRVIEEDLRKAGYARTEKQVLNKYTQLKRRWHERQQLLEISGFGIDPSTKLIEASNECWENLKVS